MTFIVAEAAVLPPPEDGDQTSDHVRHKRTLGLFFKLKFYRRCYQFNEYFSGLLSVGTGVAAGGVAIAGAAASSLIAAKPLILMGLGKCKFSSL